MALCKKGFSGQMQVFNTRSYKAGWIERWTLFLKDNHTYAHMLTYSIQNG